MAKVSVLTPSRDEKYLVKTISDFVDKAEGEVEVIAVIDGPTVYPLPEERPNVKVIQLPEPLGMRNGINVAANHATGKYLLKVDSHCSISQGYDLKLQECEDNWIVIGRRNELDAERWQISDTSPCDYWYMSSPWTSGQGYMRDCRWVSRGEDRKDIVIDETMTISGSMWFMPKVHFERIGGMNDIEFGPWCGEPQELSCKTWLSGGKVCVRKDTVYAHLRAERNYHIRWKIALRGLRYVSQYWANDKWQHPDRIHDFGWLVDDFWPLPTEGSRHHLEKYIWESDWRQKYYEHA